MGGADPLHSLGWPQTCGHSPASSHHYLIPDPMLELQVCLPHPVSSLVLPGAVPAVLLEPRRLSDHFRVLFYLNGEEMSSVAREPRSVDMRSCNFRDPGMASVHALVSRLSIWSLATWSIGEF